MGDSCGQGAMHLHWNRIGCTQERGGLGLYDDFFLLETLPEMRSIYVVPDSIYGKGLQERKQFPVNCFSYDVQPSFPVSYMWWFFYTSITLALKYQGIFVPRTVSHYWICKRHHFPYSLWTSLCFLCRKGRLPFFLHLHWSVPFGWDIVYNVTTGLISKQLQVVRCWLRMMLCPGQLTCCC